MNPAVKPVNLYQIVHAARQRLRAKRTESLPRPRLEQQLLPILSDVLFSARIHPVKAQKICNLMESEIIQFRKGEAQRRKKLRDVDDAAMEVTQNRLYVAAQTIFEEIRDALRKSRRVTIPGFGSFKIHYNVTGRRQCYDFKTREMVDVPCRPKVKFVQKFKFDLSDSDASGPDTAVDNKN